MRRTAAHLVLVILACVAFWPRPEPPAVTEEPVVVTSRLPPAPEPEPRPSRLAFLTVMDLARSVGLPDVFARIAFCESSLDPAAVHLNADGSRDHGLWQINDRWWPELFDGQDPYDSATAAQMARAVYDVQGLDAWEPSASCWQEFGTAKRS